MEYNDLTDEQKAQVMACKTAEELVALAEAEGVALSDDQLNSVVGGDDFWCPTVTSCPNYEVMRKAATSSEHGLNVLEAVLGADAQLRMDLLEKRLDGVLEDVQILGDILSLAFVDRAAHIYLKNL